MDDYSLTASPGRALPVAVRGSGLRIWDRDGTEWLDACGGAMVMSLGHCHPRLVEAVRRQAAMLSFTYRFSFSNEPMIELAGLLREIAPMERAWGFFNSSGSESVESAIHLAVLYWQHLGKPSKLELISRYPSYHGSTLGALGLSGSRWRQPFELILEKNAIAQAPGADIRARRSEADDLAFGLEQLEEAIVSRGADHVAGVFLEPISGASAAAVVPPDGYLEGVRELCDRYGVLMICDETVTAFGRTGAWFAVDHWDVEARRRHVREGRQLRHDADERDGRHRPRRRRVRDDARRLPVGSHVLGQPARLRSGLRGDPDDPRGGPRRARRARWAPASARASTGSRPARRTSARCAAAACCRGSSSSPTAPRSSRSPGGSGRLTALARDRQLMIYSCPTPLGRRTVEAVMLAPPLVVDDADVDAILDRLADAVADLTVA